MIRIGLFYERGGLSANFAFSEQFFWKYLSVRVIFFLNFPRKKWNSFRCLSIPIDL